MPDSKMTLTPSNKIILTASGKIPPKKRKMLLPVSVRPSIFFCLVGSDAVHLVRSLQQDVSPIEHATAPNHPQGDWMNAAQCLNVNFNNETLAASLRYTDGSRATGRYRRPLGSKFYKGRDGIFIVCDLAAENPFEEIEEHVAEVRNNDKQQTKVILIGDTTKVSGKAKSTRDMQQVTSMMDKYGIDAYVETNAKTRENVDAAFDIAAQLVMGVSPNAIIQSFSLSPEKQKLCVALEKYITRIELYKDASGQAVNFSYGFWVLKDSRALNRKANYYYAQYLLQELKKPDNSIQAVFSNVEETRKTLAIRYNIKANREIHSDELNNIISTATKGHSNSHPITDSSPLLSATKYFSVS